MEMAEKSYSPVQMLTVPSDPVNTQWTLVDISSGSLGEDLQKGDIDDDGDDDIIVGEWKASHRLIAFENDLCDSGTLIRHTLNSGGTGFDHHDGARVVDIDGDGDFDVVSIGWDYIVPRIFENTSSTSNNQAP